METLAECSLGLSESPNRGFSFLLFLTYHQKYSSGHDNDWLDALFNENKYLRANRL